MRGGSSSGRGSSPASRADPRSRSRRLRTEGGGNEEGSGSGSGRARDRCARRRSGGIDPSAFHDVFASSSLFRSPGIGDDREDARGGPNRGAGSNAGRAGAASRTARESARRRAGRGCPRRRGVDVRAFARARAHLRGPIPICRTNAGGCRRRPRRTRPRESTRSSPQLNSKPMPATEGIVRVERSPVTSGAAREGLPCASSPRSLSSVSTPGRVSEKIIINDVPFGLLNFSG